MPRKSAEKPEEFGDYNAYLGQTEVWPSTSEQANVHIAEMSPQYAISCWHKVKRWYVDADDKLDLVHDLDLVRTPLMQALVYQAFGMEMLSMIIDSPDLSEQAVLELLIEAMESAATADAVTHYRNAKAVADYLTKMGYTIIPTA